MFDLIREKIIVLQKIRTLEREIGELLREKQEVKTETARLKDLKDDLKGLDNQLITPEPEVGRASGPVKRRKRRGGMLSYYYREAA